MRITRHFEQRWRERVGGRPPTPQELEVLIQESIRLQRGRDHGYFQTLAIYWHPERGVVIKINPKVRTAVTVVSAHMRKNWLDSTESYQESQPIRKLRCPSCGRKTVLGWQGEIPDGDWAVEARCPVCGLVYLTAKRIRG